MSTAADIPADVRPLLGRYRSTQDRCTRRVFWYQGQLLQARKRPDQPEEPPYAIHADDLRRLRDFGLFLPASP